VIHANGATKKTWKDGGSPVTKKYLVSAPMMRKLLQQIHEGSHTEAEALIVSIKDYTIGTKMRSYAIQVVKHCIICCKNNPKMEPRPPPGEVIRGNLLAN